MTQSMRPDTPNILKKIVADKRLKLEESKVKTPRSVLENRISSSAHPRPLNMAGALMGDEIRIIAEMKKASPIKGILRPNFDPVSLAHTYAKNGAAALSILTEENHFQGSIEHIKSVRNSPGSQNLPILRKDFIFDDYQIYEARAAGADAVLLIVSILSPKDLKQLISVTHLLWMQCVVEIHNREEMDIAIESGAEIIGINNRNLHTFDVDLAVTERLASLLPREKIIVSESGIRSRKDVEKLGKCGAHAVLVGELLMKSKDPGAKLKTLL